MNTFVEAHRAVWGKRPALFVARRHGTCRWCAGPVTAGDDACFWPDEDSYRFVAHQDCLRIATEAEL